MENFMEFAPLIVVVVAYIYQNNVFVRPEQLERIHRQIIEEITTKFETKFVELNAYKEFQNHIYSELEKIHSSVSTCSSNIEDLKNLIMGGR